MPSSLVIYRGASSLDPAAGIRAVLVPAAASANRKTGAMAQLHILHDTIEPHTAQSTGDDRAVCGGCPLRPALGGGCYVVTCQGPLSTWRATARLPVAGAAHIARAIGTAPPRLGAYGDPAALPLTIIRWLSALARGRTTGYTHQWSARPDLAPYCMASVHSHAEALAARMLGFRTFRATRPDAPLAHGEILCPNESRNLSCAECLLCRGSALRAKSITIPVHGSRVSRALAVVS